MLMGWSRHESSSPMWKKVCDAGSGLRSWALRRYLAFPVTPWFLVIAGNWTLSSMMLRSWITRLGGTKAASWWPLEVGTSLPPLVMELPSRKAPVGRGRLTWPCSSLWVMVRPWLTPYFWGTWDPHTLCFLTGFPVDLWVVSLLTKSIYRVLITWYHDSRNGNQLQTTQ